MQSSTSIANLAAALAKAQSQVKPALKDSANPFFKSKYADLSSVLDACEQAASDNGIAIVQFPITRPEGIGVETILLHSSGEWISNEFVLPMVKEDAQAGGGCITYARRYAVAAAFRIRTEDDDGNAAAAAQQKAQERAQKARQEAQAEQEGLMRLKLDGAALRGAKALETAWREIGQEWRVHFKDDLAALKACAKEADVEKAVANA